MTQGARMPGRSRLWGLRRILAFNQAKLVVGVAGAAVGWGLVVAPFKDSWPAWLGLVLALPATYLVAASMVWAWYVYDHSGLYEWEWIRPLLPNGITHAVSLTAGFDGAGPGLTEVLGSQLCVIDIASGCVSLSRRVRAVAAREGCRASVRAACVHLPIRTASVEVAVLAFAAHEVHDDARCTALLAETARVLVPMGQVLVIEHVRDLGNVLAFGPAAWHFRSGRQWRELVGRAGLQMVRQDRHARLVHALVLTRASQPRRSAPR